MSETTMEISGALWLEKAGQKLFAEDRIALLEEIQEWGSITKAARAVGISYKTAWDLVNLMNNLADHPLVERSAGGKGGGGTALTAEGMRVVEQFRIFTQEHQRFLERVGQSMSHGSSFYALLRRMSLRVSARNVLGGTLTSITRGAVNSRVVLEMKGGACLVSTITNASLDGLALQVGQNAYAIIKASSIMLGVDLDGSRTSADNVLNGTVMRIIEGAVNTEVDVDLGGGNTLSAVITQDGAQSLDLKEGSRACAVFSAASVILGIA